MVTVILMPIVTLERLSSIAIAELKHYQICYDIMKEREEKLKAAVAERE
jgi:hypothetical protein